MNRNDERSVSDVLQDIFGNVQDIVRSEVRLARAEIKTEAEKTARAAKSLMAGAVLGFYAGGLLLIAAVYGLSNCARTLACRIGGGRVRRDGGGIALILAAGQKRLRLVKKPEKTIRTMKEDVQWLKDQTR